MYQYLLSSFSILLYYDSFFNNYFNLKHLFFSIQNSCRKYKYIHIK